MAADVKTTMAGSWRLHRSENFEAYLDKKGVGMIKKKLATAVSPTMTISVDGDTITIITSFGPKSNKEIFKLGEDFKPSSDDTVEKAVSTWAEDKLTTVMTPKNSKHTESTITREMVGEELIQTMLLDGVECKRIFKKA